ncbi:hypothetical protein SCP_0500120 [Sparassis crispa]|uniref:Uncharacterized protein n=1 Tax=Sparassis crispa TaxID=139825 RepID=A0A401GLH2_9APHY|nr:hypothetical protein SCP_0500120 [Sparassis crispa]GBE82969.1 hypothetical protein SCP_0500120 [Sparassis crispa]
MTHLNDPTTAERAQEHAWHRAIANLQADVEAYKSAGDAAQRAAAASTVALSLRRAGALHPDPSVAHKMAEDADAFERADAGEKERMMHPLLTGLAVLLGTPFALVGAVLVAAGGVVYGVAKTLEGVGRGLAAGPEYLYALWARSRAPQS